MRKALTSEMVGCSVYIWDAKGYSTDSMHSGCACWRRSASEASQDLEEGEESWGGSMEAGPPELCGSWFTGCRCHGSSPVFWVSGKQAGYDGALFLIPGCSSGCLFPSFFCRWGCPGRLGYPLSRRSVQVLCGSGNHSRGLDIEAICPVSSSQLPFQLQLPKSSPFLHRA